METTERGKKEEKKEKNKNNNKRGGDLKKGQQCEQLDTEVKQFPLISEHLFHTFVQDSSNVQFE